ncbi:MAG: adenine phosphoribosyltransferase [Candidatus Omnitrophota bacterium]|jgi:adenine phosphoribosyltransferase|nr:MAG: adenine phosphoribosyltransferase [Candidatus Omnitrophota bacterium]
MSGEFDFKKYIRDIPDFPKKGIIFKDITTLLKDKKAFKAAVEIIADKFKGKKIDIVMAVESRGFILGAAVANRLNAGFVPVRKKGKLPWQTISASYELEYGTDTLEVHKDALKKGDRVLLVDDLIATGGTAGAVIDLIKQLEGKICGIAFLIELAFLNGKEKLKGYPVYSLIKY